MAKGLRLEQLKEPAFSSDILNIKSKKIYINSVYDSNISDKDDNSNNSVKDNNKNKFKFLFLENNQIKKNNIIAYKLINNSKYSSVNIYANNDCVVSESKYLITENKEPSLFIVLNNSNKKQEDSNQNENVNISNTINNSNKSIDNLIDLAHKASIIDETDGIYLFEKFQKLKHNKENNKPNKIYIDAIDDQPYTSSKESILIHHPNEINFAVDILKNVFDLNNLDILFYDIEDYNREKKISKKNFNTHVVNLKVNYPARYFISKKLNYSGSIGVQAILHFARVLLNKDYKQTTTFLTVAGDSISFPRNIEVPIGTSVSEIINFFECKKEIKRIVFGQVMTGQAISSDELPISATTRSLLFFSDYQVYKQLECIGCSKCSFVCPQNLLPCYRYKFKETNNLSYQNFSSDENCLKCYSCSYICPSHIKLI